MHTENEGGGKGTWESSGRSLSSPQCSGLLLSPKQQNLDATKSLGSKVSEHRLLENLD